MNAHSLSPEDQRLWLRQWKYADRELAEQKRKDLRELSSEQALAVSEKRQSAYWRRFFNHPFLSVPEFQIQKISVNETGENSFSFHLSVLWTIDAMRTVSLLQFQIQLRRFAKSSK